MWVCGREVEKLAPRREYYPRTPTDIKFENRTASRRGEKLFFFRFFPHPQWPCLLRQIRSPSSPASTPNLCVLVCTAVGIPAPRVDGGVAFLNSRKCLRFRPELQFIRACRRDWNKLLLRVRKVDLSYIQMRTISLCALKLLFELYCNRLGIIYSLLLEKTKRNKKQTDGSKTIKLFFQVFSFR